MWYSDRRRGAAYFPPVPRPFLSNDTVISFVSEMRTNTWTYFIDQSSQAKEMLRGMLYISSSWHSINMNGTPRVRKNTHIFWFTINNGCYPRIIFSILLQLESILNR